MRLFQRKTKWFAKDSSANASEEWGLSALWCHSQMKIKRENTMTLNWASWFTLKTNKIAQTRQGLKNCTSLITLVKTGKHRICNRPSKEEGWVRNSTPYQGFAFTSDTRRYMALHDWKRRKTRMLIHALREWARSLQWSRPRAWTAESAKHSTHNLKVVRSNLAGGLKSFYMVVYRRNAFWCRYSRPLEHNVPELHGNRLPC